MSVSTYFYSTIGALFVLGFLLKAGAAPFHTYKVYMFSGLPLYSLVIYTSLFYLTYLSYFAYLIPTIVLPYSNLSTLVIIVVTVLGLLYLTNDLFTNRYLKAFFALSSSLNAVMLLLVLLSN